MKEQGFCGIYWNLQEIGGYEMINVGVIGCGHWGPNYIRNFNSLDDLDVLFCCDLDKSKLKKIIKITISIPFKCFTFVASYYNYTTKTTKVQMFCLLICCHQ